MAIDALRHRVRAKYPELDGLFNLISCFSEDELCTYLRIVRSSSADSTPTLTVDLLLTMLSVHPGAIAAEDKDELGRALLALPCGE